MSRHQQTNHTGLWVGVAIGGLVLGASLLWLSTRKKNTLKDEIMDVYDDYKDRVVTFANEVKESTAADWIQRAKQLVAVFQRYVSLLTSPKGQQLRQGLLVGGIVGSVIALGAAIMNRNSSYVDEDNVIDRIVKQANCWKNRIASVVNALEETKHRVHEHNGEHRHSSTLDDVMELAATGLQFWNKIKGR